MTYESDDLCSQVNPSLGAKNKNLQIYNFLSPPQGRNSSGFLSVDDKMLESVDKELLPSFLKHIMHQTGTGNNNIVKLAACLSSLQPNVDECFHCFHKSNALHTLHTLPHMLWTERTPDMETEVPGMNPGSAAH